jgi:biotin synthase
VTALDRAEMVRLLGLTDPAEIEALRRAAFDLTTATLGDRVHYRGIVEFSNVCALDCHYCGIRKSNRQIERYSLDVGQVVDAALWCAAAGYGSCVLQSGERRDARFIAQVEECVAEIRRRSVSAALPEGLGITLSVGEQSIDTYRRWRRAGAHRYLLRIETTNPALFARLHPPEQRLASRLAALHDLRDSGYQVGTGVMIGLPGQTLDDLAADISFFAADEIDMIGMGPYLVSAGGAMAAEGMMETAPLLSLACKMIAVTRLALGDVNIAATTALQALVPDGRERGIAFGANVTMPNLTPAEVRRNYQLYDGKPCIDEGRQECRACLEGRVLSAGRRVGWNEWGDSPRYRRRTGEAEAPPG